MIPKIAIFDFDGTIADKTIVPATVFAGFEHLQAKGCKTTISTGRGYLRLRDAIGGQLDRLVSPDTPIIIEHGTKIVNADGSLVFGEFLKGEEMEHVIEFVRYNQSIFTFMVFNPLDVSHRVQIWCSEQADVAAVTEARGHYADVFSCSVGELRQRIIKERLTTVSLKLKKHAYVENLKLSLTRTQTNLNFQDGNMDFIKSNINKGLAVLYVLRKLGVKPTDALLAGNAINDVEMLDLDVGSSVLVGPPDDQQTIRKYMSNPSRVVGIDSPSALGDYLLHLR